MSLDRGETRTTWARDRYGNPSRWIALGFALIFSVGLVLAAVYDTGKPALGALVIAFASSFRVAFGQRHIAVELARVLGSKDGGSPKER